MLKDSVEFTSKYWLIKQIFVKMAKVLMNPYDEKSPTFNPRVYDDFSGPSFLEDCKLQIVMWRTDK